MDQTKIERTLIGDRNFSLAYELGVMYPTLKSRNLASLIRRQAAEPAGRLAVPATESPSHGSTSDLL